ncbi:dnaJ homolog subfamily C member 7-like [Teleopsis dalmanni]|uniref:dnaJ homolog subfamily C member 7-like n=1 Tax=Teleopsis dalmanni TaxID=139649 RepID=UPI0018CD8512|nr:dnaJ homolog subfamily C member 7-like [Teleopsis dalmanni]
MDENIILDDLSFAKEKRKLGIKQFHAKHYLSALKLFSEAISICPYVPSFYLNRSGTFVMLSRHKDGLRDAHKAISLDPSFKAAYIRILNIDIALGDTAAAMETIKNLVNLDPKCETIRSATETVKHLEELEKGIKLNYEIKAYDNVIFYCDLALSSAPAALKFYAAKCECLLMLQRFNEAASIIENIDSIDDRNAYVSYVFGLNSYCADRIEEAKKHLLHSIVLDPECTKSKELCHTCTVLINCVKNYYKQLDKLQYQEALTVLDKLHDDIKLAPKTKCRIMSLRGYAMLKKGDWLDAIAVANKILSANRQCVEGLLLLGRCYEKLENYVDAVGNYQAAFDIRSTVKTKQRLHQAKQKLAAWEKTSYYEILNIQPTATRKEIKSAYKKMALSHHPDRHPNNSPEKIKVEEMKFRRAHKAYETLYDPMKRWTYDKYGYS